MRPAVVASTSARAASTSTSSPSARGLRLRASRPLSAAAIPSSARRTGRRGASTSVVVRAERRDGGGFTAGFILGGVVFGALGFLFAPQISSALLSDDQSRLKLPRFLDDDADGGGGGRARAPMTKQDLADRIAQLNSAIDDVSAQLRAQDEAAAAVAEEGAEAAEVVA